MSDPTSTVMAFVATINAHNLNALVSLMSDDHLFIDSVGESAQGRSTMPRAWKGYLEWFLDYTIHAEENFVSSNTVVLLGKASGTYAVDGRLPSGNHWELPAAWKGMVMEGQVSYWQVFVDNQPVRKIMVGG